MAKTTTEKKKKLISAYSLWRSYNVVGDLETERLETRVDEKTGLTYTLLTYNGRSSVDGKVRIFAYYARPRGDKKCPAVLLLKEANKPFDVRLMEYFVEKGYAVLMPDYSGKLATENEAETGLSADGWFEMSEQSEVQSLEGVGSTLEDIETTLEEGKEPGNQSALAEFTVYPPSLEYANYSMAQGLYDLDDIPADKTCWYEWTYVALYSLEYLKTLDDIDRIGVVGIRMGGEVAWKVMLSPDVACGVPINSAGWLSAKNMGRYEEFSAMNMTDERHRYIAAIDSQSYAPFVRCPVLMLCALSDEFFDADRAYDTYVRIGSGTRVGENSIVYSSGSGPCIDKNGLSDLDTFLEKHLKGRGIFIPSSLNLTVQEENGVLRVEAVGDEEAIVEEMGIYYAEADSSMKSCYRHWERIYSQTGVEIKDGKIEYTITPFEGASAAFVYAYAKYFNGFEIVSKIVAKDFGDKEGRGLRDRMLFAGDTLEGVRVANSEQYSVGNIFLEESNKPRFVAGYGEIEGAYSIGGIQTYKVGSPRYVANEGAMLKFDVYSKESGTLSIRIEVAEKHGAEYYYCRVPIKGGGKWKRIVLAAKDFKNESYGRPLSAFSLSNSISFYMDDVEGEYAVTNVLWL